MKLIDNKKSLLNLSLLALAIIAVAGCSSNSSSSKPLNQDDSGQTDSGDSGGDSSGDSSGGGSGSGSDSGNGSDGGGTDSGDMDGDSGSDGSGGQDFTYGTINPVEAIPVGEKFNLDSVSVNATPSSSGVAINQQPVLDHDARIEVQPNDSDGQSIIRLNAPIAGVENRDFTEGDLPTDFFNGEDNDLRIRSHDDEGAQFIDGSMNYAAYGDWLIRNSGGDSDVSFFAGGHETQLGNMPTSGTANYSGAAQGEVIINNGQAHSLIGQATLDVDFTSNTFDGRLTNMTARDYETDSAQPWHEVNLFGGLDENSHNRFSGIAEVVGSSPGNAASISNDSEGELRGRFYGPNAVEAAAVWSLKDPDGSAAYGAFGVKKTKQ